VTVTFSGRVVVVAGGTGGLGRAVSLAFLEEGANVVVTHRKNEELDALKTAAGEHTSRLDGRVVDVTKDAAVGEWIGDVRARHGRVDALVNTVGGWSGGKKLWEDDPGVIDRMLDVNLRAGWTLARAVVPVMLAQGRGAIVNVASKAAFEHAAGNAAYAASKAAAVAMIDALAEELRGTGVRANSIVPSIIDTEANRKAMPKANFAKWPKPEEIARVILFLCGDDARLIHGAAIPVYGNG
jgi:NAD(P)-dependent dehydrogenase (short-subunit alcohol dehydrogenase family)